MPKANAFTNLTIQFSFYCSFQKKKDGMYVAAPSGLYGKAYLLNEDQFQVFESWFIDKVRRKKPSLTRVLAAIPAILVIFGAIAAVSLGYISIALATVLSLPILIPSFWIISREDRRQTLRMMETFPFSEAPAAQHSFGTWLKRIFMCVDALTLSKWMGWMLLAFGSTEVLILVFGPVAEVIMEFLEPTKVFEPEDISRMGIISAQMAIIMIIRLGIPLSIIVPRHRFKKRTGQSMTIKNLYLDELGRELNYQQG